MAVTKTALASKASSSGAQITYDASGNAQGIAGISNFRRLPKMAGIGDSIMQGQTHDASPYYQVAQLPSAFRSVGNFAVSGKRTDEIAVQIPLAAAAGANVAVMDGGVNDIIQGVAEATLRANVISNWNKARALGMEPVDVGLPPTGTGGSVARYAAHESWRSLYCFKNDIRHVDLWTPLATATGGWRSGTNIDVTHPNSLGGVMAATPLTAALKTTGERPPYLLALTDTGAQFGSFIDNAISFAGGSTPTGYTTSGTGGTLSVTAADAGDLGAWLRCTCSGASNAGFISPYIDVTAAPLNWTVGDKLAIAFRIRWSDTGQSLSISSILSGMTTPNGTSPLFNEHGGTAGNSIYVYQETTFSSGTYTALQLTASGTGWFEINRPIVVNLTKLGLA